MCTIWSTNRKTGALAARWMLLAAAGMLAAPAMGHDEHEHDHHRMMMQQQNSRSLATYAIPNVALVGKDGAPVRLSDELNADAPVLLNFIFTTCTAVCPVSSATFSRVQSLLTKDGKKFRMISISIDPEQDTPAKLKAYASKYRAGPDWHFFTGSLADIQTVQKAFDVYRGGKMNHAPVTFMRAGSGGSWVRYEGFVEPEVLVLEYQSLASGKRLVQSELQ